MSDEPQNPISEENSIPTSLHPFDSAQDLTERSTADAPILPMDSESFDHTQDLRPTDALSEALESSPNDFSAKSNDITTIQFYPYEKLNDVKMVSYSRI